MIGFLLDLATAALLLLGAVAAGEVAAVLYFERVWLPRIAGES